MSQIQLLSSGDKKSKTKIDKKNQKKEEEKVDDQDSQAEEEIKPMGKSAVAKTSVVKNPTTSKVNQLSEVEVVFC